MGAYLMMFAAVAVGLPLPVINLIAAVIYYFVNRKKSRFVHFHSLQALLSQIPTTLINWGLVVWALWIVFTDLTLTPEFWSYAILAAVATVFYFVVSMIAAYKARQGKMYYFLLFGKLAYDIAYRIRDTPQSSEPVNKPPF